MASLAAWAAAEAAATITSTFRRTSSVAEILEPVNVPHSKAAFNENVLSLNPTKIVQPLKEGIIN